MKHSEKRRGARLRRGLLPFAGGLLVQGLVIGVALVVGIRAVKEGPVKVAVRGGGAEAAQAVEQRAQEAAAYGRAHGEMGVGEPDMGVELMESFAGIGALAAGYEMGALAGLSGQFGGGMSVGGMAGGGTLAGGGGAVQFMGETVSARRMAVLVDISATVKRKVEAAGLGMEEVAGQVAGLIGQMGPEHLYTVVQFSRRWDAFKEGLVPGTAAVRVEAEDWLATRFQTTGGSGRGWKAVGGDGILNLLDWVLGLDAALDEIVIVSDGDFQRTLAGGGGRDVGWTEIREWTRRAQEGRMGTVRISMVAFEPRAEDISAMREWVKENGNGWIKVYGAGR